MAEKSAAGTMLYRPEVGDVRLEHVQEMSSAEVKCLCMERSQQVMGRSAKAVCTKGACSKGI